VKRATKAKPSSRKDQPGRRTPTSTDTRVSPSRNLVPNETSIPRRVGYARVSTDQQTTDLQIDALKKAGCDVIFEESASGSLRSRKELERALASLRPGDTLCIWKLDRLGRSLSHLLELAEELREQNIGLYSVCDNIDTSTPSGRVIYAVIGAFAEFERDSIRERIRAGIRAKKDRGEPTGRRPVLNSTQIRAAQKMIEGGESPTSVARVLKCGRSTLYRALERETA
jgi:DNA invertase Pin-like site-specific DNA recombinase